MNEVSNSNQRKRDKRYGPNLESFAPHIFVDLLGVLPAILSWETYMRTAHVAALVMAIVFSLVGLRIVISSLFVLNTSVRMNDEFLTIRFIVGGEHKIKWQDVGSIRIVERDRNYMPPYRTHRMVQISHSLLAQRMVILHTSTWPKADEDEFIHFLMSVGVSHGILISPVTTNV